MQKHKAGKIKDFFFGKTIEEYKERVNRENIWILCMMNLAMGMFSLILCGHIRLSAQVETRFFHMYVLALFLISVTLFFLVKNVAARRPGVTMCMIVLDYLVWVTCMIAGDAVTQGEEGHLTAYYVWMAFGGCFLIKPVYMILLEAGAAALVLAHLFVQNPQNVEGYAGIIFGMLCISIAAGLLVLWFRMKALRQDEEHARILQVTTLYQSILDETQTGVYVRDLQTYEMLYINRKTCEICGVELQEGMGKKCYEIFFQQDTACENCPAGKRDAAETQDMVLHGCIYEGKGRIIDWEGREAYVGYLTDVTDARAMSRQMRMEHDSLERKYEEEVLYREKAVSEDVLASTRLNLTQGIVEEMRVGKQDGYEEKYRRQMDFTERIGAFCRHSWLLDEQKRRLSREALLEQFGNGVTRVFEEYIAELKNGEHAWVRAEANLVRRPDTDEVIAFIYSRDITRERILGHVLERIMSFEYDEIYTVGSEREEYALIAVGQYALEEQPASGRYQEKLDSLAERAVFPADREKLRRELSVQSMCEVLHEEQTHLLEVTLISKNGKPRRKRVRCMYLYEDVGTVLVTITDIEDVAKAEKEKQEQLEEALRMAEEANQAKSRFLASMSHEIRTPMNAIIGLNAIIKENIDHREQVLDCSDKLDSASKYLLALLNDILDMSRIESGNMVLTHQPFDGDRFWDNVNILAGAQADMASVRYIFEREREVSRIYLGDATRLQQIMINLINNAIKFTSENGYVKVSVTETETEDGRAALDVLVEDNGVGISEEFLPQVFGTFTQQHAESTTAYKGSGLGLSIARNFARMMDGDITVASREGVGTRFNVHVLLDTDNSQAVLKEAKEEHTERRFDGKRVLLAEDHPLNTIVAKSLLEKRGFLVTHAENGAEALRCFQESSAYTFDVVLMDIRMPVMDGIEAAMQIRALEREDARRVPLIAMTANAYEEDRRRTAEAGMDAHLAKPIDPKQLFRTLDAFIPQV